MPDTQAERSRRYRANRKRQIAELESERDAWRAAAIAIADADIQDLKDVSPERLATSYYETLRADRIGR